MLEIHDRAFKEWAVACEAMKTGRQTVLIRKGGIREEDGVFRVDDTEFFLMPTYDHQTPTLLREEYRPALSEVVRRGYDPRSVTLDAYAVVDTVTELRDERRLRALEPEHVWNDDYLKMRLDYNAYDPLYVLILRAYRLPESVTLPMRPEYAGCKSWVTLERPVSTLGAKPAISDAEFDRRRAAVLNVLEAAGA
jgi:Uncharacterized protein conserved in bacteria